MWPPDLDSEQGTHLGPDVGGAPFASWLAPIEPGRGMPPLTRLDDAPLIQDVLEGLAGNASSGRIHASETGAVVRCTLSAANADGLVITVDEGQGSLPSEPGAPLDLWFEGAHFAYAFHSALIADIEGRLLVATPARLLRSPPRWERRVPARGTMRVSFVDPDNSDNLGAPLHAPLVDVSRSGLGFNAGPEAGSALVVGRRLDPLTVTLGRGVLHLEGRVAHVSRDRRGRLHCGVSLTLRSAADSRSWERFLERALNQTTRSGQTWAEASWQLYDQSGYFRLSQKQPAQFAHLRKAFTVASRRLDEASDVGAQITWPSPRGIEASLSLLRVYSTTSLLYQVARRRDDGSPAPGRAMLRAINEHAVESLLSDASQRWLLVYVQDDGARWSRLAYRDFARRLPPDDTTCVLPFRALELPATSNVMARSGGASVGEATFEERELLLERLVRVRPRPYREALDLTREELGLQGVRALWQHRRFARDRAILVARTNGRPVAAAVLELAEEGLHLFGLLDAVRLYPLAASAELAFEPLIDAARRWYRGRGRDRFVWFAEGSQQRALRCSTLRDLGGASLIVLSRERFPEFLENLHFITAPRPGVHHA